MSVPRVLCPSIAALLLAACAAPAHGDPAAPAAPASAAAPARPTGPEYDGKVDESATAMQLDADNFLTNIATTPDGTYARFTSWYSDYELRLRALQVRVDAHAGNEASHARLEQVAKDIDQLREAHKVGVLSQDAAQKFRATLNEDWRAVLAIELAKPRGG